jgi:hypothetical protein
MTEHKNVHVALAAVQAEITDPKKTGNNTHFKSKYPTLNDVIQAARPALTKHGLCYYWTTEATDVNWTETTHIYHGASETSIQTPVPLIVSRQDMQAFKSAQTYARRMGLAGLCGLEGDEDDDGNAAKAAAPSKASQGLNDAWTDGVLDSLPANATPRQKAEAFADAIVAEFSSKGEKALSNAWEKRKKLIAKFEAEYPDLHEKVVDAFMTREVELADAKRETVPV